MSPQDNHIAEEVDCYLHDVLHSDERKQLEEHCQDCEACQAALEEGKKRFEIVRNVAASEAGEDLVQKALQRIGQYEEARRCRRKLLRRCAVGGVLAVLVLFGSSQVYQSSLRASPYDLRVVGQSQFFANSDAQLRVSVVDQINRAGVKDVPIQIELSGDEGSFVYAINTDDDGSVQPKFRLPDWKAGTYELRVTARPGGVPQIVTRTVQLRHDWKPASLIGVAKLMLSSDRPVYQPGQAIHVRSLALRHLDLKPVAGQNVTYSVIDPKENVIFKHRDITSKFGISSCDCPLADEILEGTYTVQCHAGELLTQKLQVEVRKYVLPRFKIDVAFDKPFFQPGERVTGKVLAQYFFGKPVSEGQVDLELNEGQAKLAAWTGEEGEAVFAFDDLPAALWEEKSADGVANLNVQVRVTDKAGQVQTRAAPLILARQALRVEMIPEAGTLISGVPNTVFVLVTTAAGKPAQARVMVSGLANELLTNELGFAQFQFTPPSAAVEWAVRAQNEEGQSASRQVHLQPEAGLLFRTDKAVYQGGDVVHLDAWGKASGECFVDVIKEGRTLWTQMLGRPEGVGKNGADWTTNVQLPLDLIGTTELKVYRLASDQITEYRPRAIQIRPPSQVQIATKIDRAEYLPGSKAQLDFRLTDPNGTPAPGALSVAAVDEAVYAVLQQLPGNEARFFGVGDAIAVAETTAISAEDRQLWERAMTARMVRSQRVVPDSEEPIFASSTFVKNVRFIEERQKAFSQFMGTIWSILAFLTGVPVAVSAGYFLLKFFGTLDSEAKERWALRLGAGMVFFVCIPGFIICTGMGGGLGDFILRSDSSQGELRMGLELERGQFFGMVRVFDNSNAMSAPGDTLPASSQPIGFSPLPRIREWFPETLLWRPELITNDQGEASLPLDLAHLITTWRLSTSAITADGRLGASTEKIKVFQPFFVDVRLPVALTRDDEVAVPVVVYNYLDKAQETVIKLTDADWFDRLDQAEKHIILEPHDRAKSTSFRIRAKKAGLHKLTVAALGTSIDTGEQTHADAVRRTIEVVPNGRAVEKVWNGTLLHSTEVDFTLPENAIEDSVRLLLKIYPSTFSQALEGLDSIIRMPSGCFEQTSSTTYPNVLALDYLKRTKKRMPKVEEKATAYIHQGYQRLLSFEVNGGGFDWFGRPPANRTLTAYGLLEFQDMARVHEVDPKLIDRTRKWLLDRRQRDGSWMPEGHVPAGLPGQRMSGENLARLSTTSYVAWSVFNNRTALAQAGPTVQFLQSHRPAEIDDPHALALVCNALQAVGGEVNPYLARLETLKKTTPDGKQAYWQQAAGARTTFYGHGQSGQVETTALAALALIEGRQHAGTANAALTWLIGQRDSHGTWHSTQATVLALKALLAGNVSPSPAERRIVVAWGDGRQQIIVIPEDQAEVMKLENLTKYLRRGANRLTLTDMGNTGAGYQVMLRYHEPEGKRRQQEPFTIQVRYEKDTLQVGDMLPASAAVRNEQIEAAAMVMVELPIPAGFEVHREDWAKLVQEQKIAKFQIEPQRILVYLRDLTPGRTLRLPYRLEARMPVRIQVPPGRVYEYYNPAQTALSAGATLTVLE